MCSILWWILYTWEALGCIFSNLSLDSGIGNKGEQERWRKVALHPWNLSQESRGSLCFSFAFLAFGGCGLPYEIGLTGFGNRSDRSWWNQSNRFWEPAWPVCSQSWHLFRGVCICPGGALVSFGGLCSLLEHGFVSDVSSHCPCLRGSETCLLQVILFFAFLGFRSLVEVSFCLFLFFFRFSDYQMCVSSMHSLRGRLRTMCGSRTGLMVASWCDEWLTTLCGLIFG
jgi:hypothetical protein